MSAQIIPSEMKALFGDVEFVTNGAHQHPILTVVVDTEEEFDWSEAHSRQETSVSAMADIHCVQEVFDDYGVRPCYVMDYPVASQEAGFMPLKEIFDSGRCVIGAHLHPWVSPPHMEAVTLKSSFPGNLPAELEREKLEILKDTIETVFDSKVSSYKAGRYGFGPNTATILEATGFEIDLSPSPGFNQLSEGGPDFTRYSNQPFWFGSRKQLLCLPCTGGFAGWAGRVMPAIYRLANRPLSITARMPGILSRLGVVDRIRLSPEGFNLGDLKKITRFLIKQGVKILTLSFHSPSVSIGHTPYVKSKYELSLFLHTIREYLDYFLVECDGVIMTPGEIKRKLEA